MMRRLAGLVAALLAIAALIAGAVVWRVDAPDRRLVAHFTSAVGVHEGSDVRILGIRVGEVVEVRPEGRTVRVEMRYAAGYDVPADALAVIVPPSIVSDRYVQLTPAYTSGPTLPDGFELAADRTVVPLEVDDVYRSLDELNRVLGPNGANADGALAELVATGRANLEGNGSELHDTLAGLGQVLSTLSDGRDDLFGTVANLADFTAALAHGDLQVQEFNQRLAEVAEQLAAEREDLAAALHSLSVALGDIKEFIRDHRDELESNVAALADITGVLVRQQEAIMDVLDVAPLTLSNLNLSYNTRSGTLDTRDNAMGPYDPASYVCSLMVNLVPIQQIPQTCVDLATLLSDRGLPITDELRRLLGLPPGGAPVSQALPDAVTVPGVVGEMDETLGGILRGGR